MGLGNLLILAQVTFYLLAFILSFFTFIPLTLNLNEFNGHCVMHASGRWSLEHGPLLSIDNWGTAGNCNFPIFAGIISLPLTLFYLLWMAVYLFKGTEPSWLCALTVLITSAVMVMVVFVSGILLSTGYNSWCDLLKQEIPCEIAQYTHFMKDNDINTDNFVVEFGMAQFGMWASFICWVFLLALASVQLYQYHKQEDFLISLYRERERLVQRTRGASHQDRGYSI